MPSIEVHQQRGRHDPGPIAPFGGRATGDTTGITAAFGESDLETCDVPLTSCTVQARSQVQDLTPATIGKQEWSARFLCTEVRC